MKLITNENRQMGNIIIDNIKKADKIFINVSFVRVSGLKLIYKHLLDAKQRGASIEFITSTYMQITEPEALELLYALINENINVYVHDDSKVSFHPKAYIFVYEDMSIAYVGSSNISYSAMYSGVEWNYEIKDDTQDIVNEFNLLKSKYNMLTPEFLNKYSSNYRCNKIFMQYDMNEKNELITLQDQKKMTPIKFQIPALRELKSTRYKGFKKAMVVAATGLGKTYLSVFDSIDFKRILFVAHQELILEGAKSSYENYYQNDRTYGFFHGTEKTIDCDILFANISTIGQLNYLNESFFSKDHFDYIVIDEFHHATAKNYQNLINYFEPDFLLGITATPNRMDQADVFKLCDHNVAYECDLFSGIANGWLVPFKYYSFADQIDYEDVSISKNGYIENNTSKRIYSNQDYLDNVVQKFLFYRKNKSLVFCASIEHAKIISDEFSKNNIQNELIIGATNKFRRLEIIREFKNGDLDVIIAVDVFNEGVDVPNIDTVLMLRPTLSSTIFLQQLGRGLRTHDNKKELTVIDFIGNYKDVDQKLELFTNKSLNVKTNNISLENFSDFEGIGCSFNFDFQVIDIIQRMEKTRKRIYKDVIGEYNKIYEQLQHPISILEFYEHSNIMPSKQNFQGGYYKFLSENKLVDFNEVEIEFLQTIVDTHMERHYKMFVLKTFLANNFKENKVTKVDISKIGLAEIKRKKHVSKILNLDFDGLSKLTEKQLIAKYVKMPCDKLSGAHPNIFENGGSSFQIKEEIYNELRIDEKFIKEVEEIIEYRLIKFYSQGRFNDK